MKKLSIVQSVYLLLVPTILSLVVTSVFLVIYGRSALEITQDSFVFKIVNSLLSILIYLNVLHINKYFKKMALLKTVCIILDLLAFVFTNLTSLMIFKFYMCDILEFIKLLVTVPCIYYFYKGFYELTKEYGVTSLSAMWKKLGAVNLIVSIFSVIEFPLSLFGVIASFPSVNILWSFVFGIGLGLIIIVLSILKFVYIIKTTRALKSQKI